MNEHLDAHNIAILIIALSLILISIIVFYHNKKWGVRILLLASGALAFFMASLDPFLNVWDEQQHALVAKHMAETPFYPTLYKTPILGHLPHLWISNHVWIHKQPLFLWQMALSIKLFGANTLAVRLPSVIMHAILPYFIYRMGTIVRNEQTGFIAALFMTMAYFPLQLVSGWYATDHNDMAFLFYLSWSFLCWFEYQQSGNKKWLIWLGIASGGAVLVKWLMGLLVYVCWFAVITFKNRFAFWKVKSYLIMVKPFVLSCLVFIPWQIYCFVRFPVEAAIEFEASASHFSHVVEGHAGAWNYHFTDAFSILYYSGDVMLYVLIALIGIGIWRIKDNLYRTFLGFGIVFIYAFFSLAATKMLGFTLIAMPLILICMASAFDSLRELWGKKLKIKWLSYFLLMAVIAYPLLAFFDVKNIMLKHSNIAIYENGDRSGEMQELYLITLLRERYGDQKTIIFNGNVTPVGSIQIMFFSEYIAYPQIPSSAEIDEVLVNGYTCVIIDRGDVSEELKHDPRVEIFPFRRID